jgi:hypothetical protein
MLSSSQTWITIPSKCSLFPHIYIYTHVLASFVSTWHSWTYHRERSFSWGNASMRHNCKAFSQLVIKGERPLVGGTISGLVVLGSIREQAEQASKEHPSMASVSAPASCPAWDPVLTSFGDEQQYGSVRRINPFLPNLLLGLDVWAGIETLTKTTHIHIIYICTSYTFIHVYIYTAIYIYSIYSIYTNITHINTNHTKHILYTQRHNRGEGHIHTGIKPHLDTYHATYIPFTIPITHIDHTIYIHMYVAHHMVILYCMHTIHNAHHTPTSFYHFYFSEELWLI